MSAEHVVSNVKTYLFVNGCFLLGRLDLVEKIEKDEVLMNNKFIKQGIADMKLFLEYLDIYNVCDKVR